MHLKGQHANQVSNTDPKISFSDFDEQTDLRIIKFCADLAEKSQFKVYKCVIILEEGEINSYLPTDYPG